VVHVGAFDGSREREGEAAEERYARVQGHFSSVLSTARGGSPLPLVRARNFFISLAYPLWCRRYG
jgi:hypothetical protein